MEFIETSAYRKIITDLINDEQHRAIQNQLLERPDLGTAIPGASGLRKARFGLGSHGKRGGFRLWYIHLLERDIILLVFAQPKNKGSDITREMTRLLAQDIKREFK
jgi:hypothetical protein